MVARPSGTVTFATAGDGFAAAFGRVNWAVDAAVGPQRTLSCADWPDGVRLTS